MATQILKSFDALRSELEQAKSSLKGVDENLKRLIGRDPSELPPRPEGGVKRPLNERLSRPGAKMARRNFESNDQPVRRRNPNAVSVFQRLSERPVYEEVEKPPKGLISKVIVTPKEVPSRQKALEAQSKDEKFKERNRRMFGALLGTLQKFQQEENKLKKREEKKAQVEKKIEEHEIKEKEEIRKERQELFYNRRKKQAEIKMLELKMLRMREHTAWEEKQKPRSNFIMTKAKPHIHYVPRRMTDKTRQLLEVSKEEITNEIEKKRLAVADELKRIEDRMRKNFEQKFGVKDKGVTEAEPDEDAELDHHFDDDLIIHSPKDQSVNETIKSLENDETVEENKVKIESQLEEEAADKEEPFRIKNDSEAAMDQVEASNETKQTLEYTIDSIEQSKENMSHKNDVGDVLTDDPNITPTDLEEESVGVNPYQPGEYPPNPNGNFNFCNDDFTNDTERGQMNYPPSNAAENQSNADFAGQSVRDGLNYSYDQQNSR